MAFVVCAYTRDQQLSAIAIPYQMAAALVWPMNTVDLHHTVPSYNNMVLTR